MRFLGGMRGLALGGLITLVAACGTGPGGGTGGGFGLAQENGGGFLGALTGSRQPLEVLTRATLVGGDIAIRAPEGWCIEPQSLRARGQRGFALLVGCRALTEGQSGPHVPYGALTVAVSPRRAEGDAIAPDALREVVTDETVLARALDDGVALVHLRPVQAASDAGLGDPHWRAILAHGGRAIALAAYGPAGGEISGPAGGDLLRMLARGLRDTSPGGEE